jgi:hypothetical protein
MIRHQTILIALLIVGCAVKPVNNTEVPEPVGEPRDTKEEQPEVAALLVKYESFIGEVAHMDDDVGFLIGDTWIYFRGGRMLTKESLPHYNV